MEGKTKTTKKITKKAKKPQKRLNANGLQVEKPVLLLEQKAEPVIYRGVQIPPDTSITEPSGITPSIFLDMCNNLLQSDTSIQKTLDRYKVGDGQTLPQTYKTSKPLALHMYSNFLDYTKKYAWAGTVYKSIRYELSEKIEQSSVDLFDSVDLLPKSCFEVRQIVDRESGQVKNHRVLTSAGAGLLKAKSTALRSLASRLVQDREDGGDIKGVVIHNNLNINLRDLMTKDISDLSDFTTSQ